MKILITLVFLGFTAICTAQSLPGEFTRLRTALSQSKADTTKVNAMLDLAKYYFETSRQAVYAKKLDSAAIYVRKAEKFSETINFQAGLARSYLLSSGIALRQDEESKGGQLALRAAAIFEKLGAETELADAFVAAAKCGASKELLAILAKANRIYLAENNKKGVADVARTKGHILMILGNLKAGRDELQRSLVLYDAIGYEKVQMVYALIAINYNTTGDIKEAADYTFKALRAVEKFDDTSSDAAVIYNYAAVTYRSLRDLDKTLEYLRKSHDIAIRHNTPTLVVMLENNLIQTLMETKRYKEALVYLKKLELQYRNLPEDRQLMIATRAVLAYSSQKEYKKAGKYVPKLMTQLPKINPKNATQNYLYSGLIMYYMGIKDYGNARKLADAYKLICEQNNYKLRLREMYEVLYEIDNEENKYDSAMKNYKKSQSLYNDRLSETKNKQIAELQIKYDIEKKDNNNKILTQKNQLQQAKLERASLVRNIGIGGILFLLVFLIALYSRYNIKRKSNRLLETQKIEIDDKNMILQKLVTEKEWLLREIHHRVKNNLQTIMSLLNTQAYFLKDDSAMDAIRNSQHRIHSMSLIHKKLYQSENVVTIDMPTYIKDLIEYFRSFFETRNRIRFIASIDAIAIDISQAVPLGLILNEAITNAVKHAFPDDKTGTITIEMKRLENAQVQLTIADNGVGSTNTESAENASLGMKLINGFSGDLDAQLSISSADGFKIILTFEIKDMLENDNELSNISA